MIYLWDSSTFHNPVFPVHHTVSSQYFIAVDTFQVHEQCSGKMGQLHSSHYCDVETYSLFMWLKICSALMRRRNASGPNATVFFRKVHRTKKGIIKSRRAISSNRCTLVQNLRSSAHGVLWGIMFSILNRRAKQKGRGLSSGLIRFAFHSPTRRSHWGLLPCCVLSYGKTWLFAYTCFRH